MDDVPDGLHVPVPDDLRVRIHGGKLYLESGGRTVEVKYRWIFGEGSIAWRDLLARYIVPALWQFHACAGDPALKDCL